MLARSDEIDAAMLGNWTLSAMGTGSDGVGVRMEGETVALWTWPIEAEAMGIGSKCSNFVCQSEPSSATRSFFAAR